MNFSNCLNSGAIGGSDATKVGGIFGSQSDTTGTVSFVNCANTGAITGKKYIGGMTGAIETGTVSVTDCTNTGTIIGASNASPSVGAVYSAATGTIENFTNSGNLLTMVGSQTSAVVEGTYDLRFVAAFNDAKAQAAGFVVTVYYKDATGKKQLKVENETVYAKTVYTSVKGTTAENVEEPYKATDFGGTYLYTLVIENIDSAYTVADGTLEILIAPFIAENEETVINASQAQYGEIVIEKPAA